MGDPARPGVRWTDSHCHLQEDPDPAATLAAAGRAGVERVVCVGTDREWSERALALAASLGPGVWATVGLHPHEASRGVETVADLIGAPDRPAALVAVGECGLDYHYDHSPRPAQREAFAAQVGLAVRHGLALVVHSRSAWDDTFDILGSEGPPERLVLHCFTGGPGEARRALDLGAYLSFSGIVTFPAAEEIRRAAALCPPGRLMVETDSPFLAPVPHRGRPNQPAWVPAVGAGVAAARSEPVEAVAEASWRSAATVFGLGD
ncbi:MAG TPA: TatD family hydrolase [Acidimicrobiales bacterium]|nr:TatD family hydrolase [Acidimicrobiales bacterium]